MKIIMAGIDYNKSSIELRELISFNRNKVYELNKKIKSEEGIYGCVVVSTCNRTEIYLSCTDDFEIKADKLLLEKSGVNHKLFDGLFYHYENEKAIRYLFELACGLKSQILGEAQISGQLNDSVKISRETNSTDSYIETLFRLAVTAGKEAITKANLINVHPSSALLAVEKLKNIYGNNLKGKKCVVIGNGKIGRLTADLLIDIGAEVFITLRSYKHGETIIPFGSKTIPYKDRLTVINNCDVVISATTSPHYTLCYDDIHTLDNKPQIMVDLAVPRDIDPEIDSIKNVKLFNIDDFKSSKDFNKAEFERIYEIIDKYTNDFYKWESYKNAITEKNIINTSKFIGKENFNFLDHGLLLQGAVYENSNFFGNK